jgi:PadR family transcriptional regulator AphA
VLAGGPAHGYAVAQRLARDGDLGRVWTLSRPMTYRSLAQLEGRGLVRRAGPAGEGARRRAVVELTPAGRRAIDRWLDEPVEHLRDLRSELLLKVLLARALGRTPQVLLERQRAMADRVEEQLRAELAERAPGDPVLLWRLEVVHALRRVIQQLV